MRMQHTVQVGRIYAESTVDDGARILVDRLWPRGVSKSKAQLDEWCQDVAPSTALRTWYRHDPALFFEFTRRYQAELAEPARAAAFAHLQDRARTQRMTLLTASKFPEISEAAVLAGLLNTAPTAEGAAPPAAGRIADRSPEDVFASIQRSIGRATAHLAELPSAALYRTASEAKKPH